MIGTGIFIKEITYLTKQVARTVCRGRVVVNGLLLTITLVQLKKKYRKNWTLELVPNIWWTRNYCTIGNPEMCIDLRYIRIWKVILHLAIVAFASNLKSFAFACVIFLIFLVGVSEMDWKKSSCQYSINRYPRRLWPGLDLLM